MPGAVLTRVARSHVRVGTFQYFYYAQDHEALRVLADYVIERHYPELATAEAPHAALLRAVMARQATLVAAWSNVGFIHGVMNTDNMQIAGETIDYGPCAFMDAYHPDTVFSSIDHAGRYAYSNQHRAAHWNIACLAQALLPLLHEDEAAGVEVAQAIVDEFPALHDRARLEGMRAKLGLRESRDEDATLIHDLLELMAAQRADFTLTFRALGGLGDTPGPGDGTLRAHFTDPTGLDAWLTRWRQRLAAEGSDQRSRSEAMARTNPAVIPRNHLVENAIQAALSGSHDVFHALVDAVTDPYRTPSDPTLERPPEQHEVVQQTFCGT